MKSNCKAFKKTAVTCAAGCLFAFMAFLCGCMTQPPEPDAGIVTQHPEKILVLPFKDLYRVFGENVSYRCPVSGKVYLIESVADGADEFLTNHLMSVLIKRKGLELIPPGQAQGVISALLFEERTEVTEAELILKAGQRLQADAVLLNRVYRFRQRVGTRYSVESPASVGLDMLLIRVPDSRLIWNGYVDKTQQSLSENLFRIREFIKMKGQWISAEELAAFGMDDSLKTFPFP